MQASLERFGFLAVHMMARATSISTVDRLRLIRSYAHFHYRESIACIITQHSRIPARNSSDAGDSSDNAV